MNYTYILECNDGSLYTGWTNDIKKRLNDHNQKKGARYTRCRVPVHLKYYEIYDSKEEAMKREFAIKRLSRMEKKLLIDSFADPLQLLDNLSDPANKK